MLPNHPIAIRCNDVCPVFGFDERVRAFNPPDVGPIPATTFKTCARINGASVLFEFNENSVFLIPVRCATGRNNNTAAGRDRIAADTAGVFQSFRFDIITELPGPKVEKILWVSGGD